MRAVSLFTCGMGLDLGFENAGFRTVYANDIQRYAYDTIRANRPDVPCDMHDIASVPSSRIAGYAGGFDVLIGEGTLAQRYMMVGEAVPVMLAAAVARSIRGRI